jgi:hypothetical protein
MKKNYYKMFPEKRFAIVVFQSATLSIEDAERINFDYKSDSQYSEIVYLLVIFKNCIPQFNPSDLKFLSDTYNKPLQTNNHKTVVWLVDEPLVTAYAHMFVPLTDGNAYCSTIQQAYCLLDVPFKFEEFNNLIQTNKKNILQ